ncbi:MAG TPA: hypothetical protein VGI03_07870 [Verrucomicrobiae bacterium]
MKTILAILLLSAISTKSQTNQFTTNTIFKTALTTNWYKAPDNFRRFGNKVFNFDDLIKTRNGFPGFYTILGNVNNVEDGLVIAEAEAFEFDPNAKPFDTKTVAITNYPDAIIDVAEGQKIEAYALRIGVVNVDGRQLELYDYGTPWVYGVTVTNKIPITTELILLK